MTDNLGYLWRSPYGDAKTIPLTIRDCLVRCRKIKGNPPMPRLYDLAATPTNEQYDATGLFVPLSQPRIGKGEVITIGLLADANQPSHQFEYQPLDGTAFRDNGQIDPVFGWIEQHATGPWNWHETCLYPRSRALALLVWFERDIDAAQFLLLWSDRFVVRSHAIEHNATLKPVTPTEG
jgi:hypothetical protein